MQTGKSGKRSLRTLKRLTREFSKRGIRYNLRRGRTPKKGA